MIAVPLLTRLTYGFSFHYLHKNPLGCPSYCNSGPILPQTLNWKLLLYECPNMIWQHKWRAGSNLKSVGGDFAAARQWIIEINQFREWPLSSNRFPLRASGANFIKLLLKAGQFFLEMRKSPEKIWNIYFAVIEYKARLFSKEQTLPGK